MVRARRDAGERRQLVLRLRGETERWRGVLEGLDPRRAYLVGLSQGDTGGATSSAAPRGPPEEGSDSGDWGDTYGDYAIRALDRLAETQAERRAKQKKDKYDADTGRLWDEWYATGAED